MKITAKLLLDMNRRGTKEPVSVRVHEDICNYWRQRAYDLGLTQARYVEGLILAEAASTKGKSSFDLKISKLREFLC